MRPTSRSSSPRVGERVGDVPTLVELAGPVIGTHAGAGFIGLAVTHT